MLLMGLSLLVRLLALMCLLPGLGHLALLMS
jgi:hypothetical protein